MRVKQQLIELFERAGFLEPGTDLDELSQEEYGTLVAKGNALLGYKNDRVSGYLENPRKDTPNQLRERIVAAGKLIRKGEVPDPAPSVCRGRKVKADASDLASLLQLIQQQGGRRGRISKLTVEISFDD